MMTQWRWSYVNHLMKKMCMLWLMIHSLLVDIYILLSLCLLWCIWWSYGWCLYVAWAICEKLLWCCYSVLCDILCLRTCYWCIWWRICCLRFVTLPMCEESMLILMRWDQGDELLTELDCTILCYNWLMMSSWFTRCCWYLSLMRRYIQIVVTMSWVINDGWIANRDLIDDYLSCILICSMKYTLWSLLMDAWR